MYFTKPDPCRKQTFSRIWCSVLSARVWQATRLCTHFPKYAQTCVLAYWDVCTQPPVGRRQSGAISAPFCRLQVPLRRHLPDCLQWGSIPLEPPLRGRARRVWLSLFVRVFVCENAFARRGYKQFPRSNFPFSRFDSCKYSFTSFPLFGGLFSTK